MDKVLVLRRKNDCTILDLTVEHPFTSWGRFRGLMGRPPLPESEAMWLSHTSAIHTFGMRAPIDVVFVSANGRIVRVVANVAPNRPFVGAIGATNVLEAPPGTIERLSLKVGDSLFLEPR